MMMSSLQMGIIGVTILVHNLDAAVLRGTQKRHNDRSATSRKEYAPTQTFARTDGILPQLDPISSRVFNATVPTDDNETATSLLDSASMIAGGTAAVPTEAKFFSLLLTYDNSRGLWKNLGCGGALISDRHILTAAHCLKGRTGSNDAVYVNAYTPFKGNVKNNTRYPYHFSKVQSYQIHPSFNDGSNAHDIGIITMERPITNSDQFPAVRLLSPLQNISDNETTSIYGFGRTISNVATSVDTLQTVRVPFVPFAQCKAYYTWNLLPDMICAGELNSKRDACPGDSGGPMTIARDGIVYQIGVISWGAGGGCGLSNKPSVYSSVQFHYNWIQQSVCNNTRSPGINQTTALCYNTTSSEQYAGLSAVPVELTSSTCTGGKPDGLPCSYGGECCSGVCGLPSLYYNARLCLRNKM